MHDFWKLRRVALCLVPKFDNRSPETIYNIISQWEHWHPQSRLTTQTLHSFAKRSIILKFTFRAYSLAKGRERPQSTNTFAERAYLDCDLRWTPGASSRWWFSHSLPPCYVSAPAERDTLAVALRIAISLVYCLLRFRNNIKLLVINLQITAWKLTTRV